MFFVAIWYRNLFKLIYLSRNQHLPTTVLNCNLHISIPAYLYICTKLPHHRLMFHVLCLNVKTIAVDQCSLSAFEKNSKGM